MEHSDAVAAVRRAQDRELDREGIPMVLALVDCAGPPEPAAERADGPGLAATMDAYHSALAPDQRDGDLGIVHTILTVVAHEDFDRSRLR